MEFVKKKNIIVELSFDFSLKAIKLYKMLTGQHEFVISKQFLRSATSIGANVQEAMAAVTKKEFIYKLSIATREARETRYWLQLLSRSQMVKMDFVALLQDIEIIINILTKIIKTTRENLKTENINL